MNREIEYILEVSKHESILKASKNLFITPSALSKYIKQTEEKYGVRFFDRVGKKFTLTYAGERYLYWLHQQERVITNMENELSNIAGSQSGRIRVGIQSTLARFWLNHVLVPFKAAYPDINVELIDDINPEIARMINNNELDFVILQEDNSYLQNTIYQHLVMAHLVVASSKNNDKLQQCSQQKRHHKYPWIPLDKLDGILFVLPFDNTDFRKNIDLLLRSQNININSYILGKSVATIMECVRADLGITIMPTIPLICNEHSQDFALYSFGEKDIEHQYLVAHHKNHYLTEPMKELIRNTKIAFNSTFIPD